jgi:myo-inositol-1(or 4)-monophosphatase
MPIRSALITVMERACRKVGPQLRRDFGEVEHLQVSQKGTSDFVSNADKKAERTLYEQLGQARPGWGFLFEEAGEIKGDGGPLRWIVDPLDGTTNFLHGIPHFAISIAVEEEGEIVAGMIYNPITDDTFWAEKGFGAWLHDKRLRVSARRDMEEAVFATGIPFKGRHGAPQFEATFNLIRPEVAGIRRFGSAALDLAWTAAGRYDGFWEFGLAPWDVAAGILIVKEAGGFVTDARGGQDMLKTGDIVAGNSTMHSKLHKLVVDGLKTLG